MVKLTAAQSFEISNLKNLLEKPWNPSEVTRICDPSKSSAWRHHCFKLGWELKKETILMVFFAISNLKSAIKYKSWKVLLSCKTVYSGISKLILYFHILFISYVLYFPLWTSTLYFPCFPFFFIDRTW